MGAGAAPVVAPPDEGAVETALAAFAGMQRGAAGGDWRGFTDLLSDDAKVMIPVPPHIADGPEGLLIGRAQATALLDAHHHDQVADVRLDGMRIAANGSVVMIEARVEGRLGGERAANHYVFTFDVRDGAVAAMYHYAIWTAKRSDSGWSRPGFAREAFATAILPADGRLFAGEGERAQ